VRSLDYESAACISRDIPKDGKTVLVLCAASTHVNTSDIDTLPASNLRLDECHVSLIDNLSPRQVIFLSSISVYDARALSGGLLSLNSKTTDTDKYGLSKLNTEAILRDVCSLRSIPLCILRLPGVVGYNSHSNFLASSIQSLLLGKPLTVYNPSQLFNNVIAVSDVWRIVQMLAKTPYDGIQIPHADQAMMISQLFDFLLSLVLERSPSMLSSPEYKSDSQRPSFIIAPEMHPLLKQCIQPMCLILREAVEGSFARLQGLSYFPPAQSGRPYH
jgi:nucleoside-diphosphate-sugar epimerase